MDDSMARRERENGNLGEGGPVLQERVLEHREPQVREAALSNAQGRPHGLPGWPAPEYTCSTWGAAQVPCNVSCRRMCTIRHRHLNPALRITCLRRISGSPIDFRGIRFDFVVAQGMFEYVGEHPVTEVRRDRRTPQRDGKFVSRTRTSTTATRGSTAVQHVQRPASFRATSHDSSSTGRSRYRQLDHSQPRRP